MHKFLSGDGDTTASSPPAAEKNLDHVADKLDLLARKGREVSVVLDALKTPLVGRITRVDRQQHAFLIELAEELVMSKSRLLKGCLSLEVKQTVSGLPAAEYLDFDEIQPLELRHVNGRTGILCTMPHSFFSATRRGEIRIPFIQGLYAHAWMTIYKNSEPFRASLCNLSRGGCMIEVPLQHSGLFETDRLMHQVNIVFPNGEGFTVGARVSHLRPAGRTHFATVGLEFTTPDNDTVRRIRYFLNEMESELACRIGLETRAAHHSPIFTRPSGAVAPQEEVTVDEPESVPLIRAMREIARRLHGTLIALRNDEELPRVILYDCVETIIHMLQRKRQQCLYASGCLTDEPPLLQLALRSAIQLGDMLLSIPSFLPYVRDAIFCALLHNIGKPMMVNESMPSLSVQLTPSQKRHLSRHREVLLARLAREEWLEGHMIHRFMRESRTDPFMTIGAPPWGMDQIARIAQMFSVIRRLNGAMWPSNPGKTGMLPLEAYRDMYSLPEEYDRDWIVQYVQRHGVTPIGSLVYFSRGYLGWVMSVDARGDPVRVRVVRNLNDSEGNLSMILSRVDFDQMGEITGTVRPKDYDLMPC
ncbi:PilZ domain-containing protein [Larsenimonas rhizosphaerae]|uniref:PilZ domain-containing protein n=1 Tax=Larsenimonas rhizosphaerae TaxID=2944682 RepID=A0AA41ZGA3_9GAMM|nr:PilZ domain-containing protein [Larsenimonas rhizosphaerae]MCM2131955.1 PilZ domain-containing protein [Larsenimonas rhizosphaerae]MCX2524739.1 PilZ domain-containing protein [Larsenimonas rhizosphaerae]